MTRRLFTLLIALAACVPCCAQEEIAVTNVTASSEYATAYSAEKAVDEDANGLPKLSTYWVSGNSVNVAPQTITMSLGGSYSLNSVDLHFHSSTYYSTNYDILASDDGSSFEAVLTQLNAQGDPEQNHALNGAVASHVRIRVNEAVPLSFPHALIRDIRIYGTPPASYTASWNGTQLSLTFTDANDWIHLREDSEGYLVICSEPGEYDPVSFLLANGERINGAEVGSMILSLGGGNDTMAQPDFRYGATITVHGGDGDDYIKIPANPGVAYAYGGNGGDTFSGEHNATNYFYGESGSDLMWGGSDGYNFLSGGPGRNVLYSFKHIVRCPCVQPTVFVHTLGARDEWNDLSEADNWYVLDGAPGPIGELDVDDNGGGNDRFYLNGHEFDVDANGTIVSPVVTGSFEGWTGVEQVLNGSP